MNETHSDAKHAKSHGKSPVETGEMHLEKDHKDWYHADTMGKQRGKPRYDLKEQKKNVKSWKKK